MRRERAVQGNPSKEKNSLNRTVAELKAATMTFASTEKDTEKLRKEKSDLESSISVLKTIESGLTIKIEQSKTAFQELEKEHNQRLADFRRELIVPPKLVSEKEDITKSIEDGKQELLDLSLRAKEVTDSLKASEDALNNEIEKKRGQVVSLSADVSLGQKRNDLLSKQLNDQQGLLTERDSTVKRLEASIVGLQQQKIDLEDAISQLKKEALEFGSSNKDKQFELSKTEKKLKETKEELEGSIMSVISLSRRESAVKQEEARLKKIGQKFGVPMNL